MNLIDLIAGPLGWLAGGVLAALAWLLDRRRQRSKGRSEGRTDAQTEARMHESSESGGRTEIVLSVEQDITINAEQSIDQIREQIEQLVEDGATDALRQLERKISNGEGLNV